MDKGGPFVSDEANVAAKQWPWVAQSLHDSIANLGYPVGMGLTPNPESTERAAKLICEHVARMIDEAAVANRPDTTSQITEEGGR